MRGSEERDRAAHAEAGDADFADALDGIDRSLGVAQHRLQIGLADHLARLGDIIGRVARLEVLLHAIEHGRCDRDVAGLSKPIGHRADMVIDAENLLDHDDCAVRRAVRIGTVGAELEAVR